MDFMHDELFNGRRFRLLTLVDNFSRESLAIEVGQSLKGSDVVRVLERLAKTRKLPRSIRVDNVLTAESSGIAGQTHPSGEPFSVLDI